MSYTQSELDALKQAYAAGALRIVHDGKTVEYGSESDLRRRIRVIESEIAATSSNKSATRSFARSSRG